MVNEKIIEAFHLMWYNFPRSVRLIHKDRTVLAVNKTAFDLGFEVGVSCAKIGKPEVHKGCKANLALATKNARVEKLEGEKIRYWIPVKDCDEVYVHFTTDVSAIE